VAEAAVVPIRLGPGLSPDLEEDRAPLLEERAALVEERDAVP
jgi:hypothetical protein